MFAIKIVTKYLYQDVQRKGSPTRAKSAPLSADVRRETEEILNTILPPKEWEEDSQKWKQQVSSTPATRLDVVNLQEQLDMRLQQRQVCFNCYIVYFPWPMTQITLYQVHKF